MDSKIYTAIGLMSGTSMDGVDAAIIKTDGERIVSVGEYLTVPYETDLRNKVNSACAKACEIGGCDVDVVDVERELTDVHIHAINLLLSKSSLKYSNIDIIGFHGQTIYHAPEKGVTWQIGDGKMLAETTGIDVINNFRIADVENGGQGAPLVPLYHAAMLKEKTIPQMVVNIGGVSNITYINGDYIAACDVGPGNALLDDWIKLHTGKFYDDGGEIGRAGVVDASVLDALMSNPFYALSMPKSLDRNHFVEQKELYKHLSLEDGAATLAAYTAKVIMRSAELVDSLPPEKWYITGGGRHNAALMQAMQQENSNVYPIESIGYNGDALEAQAFGFLAVRSLKKLPLTLPTTTGVKRSLVTGGVFFPGGSYQHC